MKLGSSFMSAIYLGPSPSGKTKMFEIAAEGGGGVTLGTVKWYAPWRRFCFFATNGAALFDAGCLRALGDFCAAETDAQKQRQKERRVKVSG